MKKIVVTGATGFIGSHLIKSPSLKCCELHVLSRRRQKGLETIICDLQSDFTIGNAFNGVETIYHLAGLAHDLGNSSEFESIYRKVNFDATIRLIELAAEQRVERFIFVSSVKAGVHSKTKKSLSECDFEIPEGLYGQIKRETELRVLEIGRNSGMHVSIIRPALVYGPKVKGNLRLMLSGIKKGWFPPLPETGNRKSMIHVDNLVRAILMVAEDDRAAGEIFVATDGVSYSSREIFEAMCNLLGKPVPRWKLPKFLFDVLSLVHPRMREKIDKLFRDEYYSSGKLQSMGFVPTNTLKDWTEI